MMEIEKMKGKGRDLVTEEGGELWTLSCMNALHVPTMTHNVRHNACHNVRHDAVTGTGRNIVVYVRSGHWDIGGTG